MLRVENINVFYGDLQVLKDVMDEAGSDAVTVTSSWGASPASSSAVINIIAIRAAIVITSIPPARR